MSTLDTLAAPADTAVNDDATGEAASRLRGRWPLAAFVSALSLGAFPYVGSTLLDEDVTGQGQLAVYDAIKDNGFATHISVSLGFLGALTLAVFASGFLRFLADRTPRDSGLGHLARIGMSAAVGLSIASAILKAIYRGGLPDHADSAMYTRETVATLQIIVDQFQWTGMWPLVLTMASVAALALRARVLPRWYGFFSAFLVVTTLAMALIVNLPYFIGIVGPFWLIASGIVALRHRGHPVNALAQRAAGRPRVGRPAAACCQGA